MDEREELGVGAAAHLPPAHAPDAQSMAFKHRLPIAHLEGDKHRLVALELITRTSDATAKGQAMLEHTIEIQRVCCIPTA